MSEAEYQSDCGNLVFEEQAKVDEFNRLNDFEDTVCSLEGKWVVARKGMSGDVIFLQDRSLSCSRWWAYHLSSAVVFPSEAKAKECVGRFKYGNPEAIKVTKSMAKKLNFRVHEIF